MVPQLRSSRSSEAPSSKLPSQLPAPKSSFWSLSPEPRFFDPNPPPQQPATCLRICAFAQTTSMCPQWLLRNGRGKSFLSTGMEARSSIFPWMLPRPVGVYPPASFTGMFRQWRHTPHRPAVGRSASPQRAGQDPCNASELLSTRRFNFPKCRLTTKVYQPNAQQHRRPNPPTEIPIPTSPPIPFSTVHLHIRPKADP